MSRDAGLLLARGRAADVFEDAPGSVRRRYRTDRDCRLEATVMEHARTQGFPVPAVIDVRGPEIVMERVDGRSMLEDLVRAPWRVRSHARLLAALHRDLHHITAPASLPAPFGADRSLLHLDLHPGNVLLSPAGPFVIDWTNAAAGPPLADVAQTWVLLASSLIPGPIWQRALGQLGRDLFLRAFLHHHQRSEVLAYLPAVARLRLCDQNLQDPERRVIARMLERLGPM
jgi:aminoglycoside phosphotransferase (APT) family kinase protein